VFVDQSVSSKARRAASIALPMSSALASAATPSTSSVAGLIVPNVPAVPATSFPSISNWLWRSSRIPILTPDSACWTAVRLYFFKR